MTTLCGSFPGMLAGAAALLPIYLYYLSSYGAEFARMLFPVEYTVYCALIALILGGFIRRESFRKPWMILPVTIVCGLVVAPLKEVLRILHAGTLGFGIERIQTELKALVSPENFPDFLGDMGYTMLGIAVSMALSLAIYHLLPRKWREKLRSVSWMMKPLPVAAARKIRNSSGKGYGHSVKSRITILVIIAVFLSALMVTVVANSNISKIAKEESKLSSFILEYNCIWCFAAHRRDFFW